MKKAALILGAALVSMGLSMTGFCAETESEFYYPAFEQSASAWLDQDGNEVHVTVDLTDGWSVEFAHGAAYLYDENVTPDLDAAAIALTLDKETFDDYAKTAAESDSYREFARSFAYTDEEGWQNYFYSLGPDVYFMVSVAPEADGDAVSSRFSITTDNSLQALYNAQEGEGE